MVRLLITIVMGVAALSGVRSDASSVIYVDASATGVPHDGSDWCCAFVDLHEALAVAGPDTTVRVAGGVYLPDSTGLSDPREATFVLADGVAIEGGYAGCGAADPNERDFIIHETALSGDIGVAGVASDNCYHVITCGAVGASTVLDGVTIRDGNANVSSAHRQGGGLLLTGGSPTVRDCVFRQNSAEYGGGAFVYGGSAVFDGARFDENSATESGGGLYLYNSLSQPAPSATDCIFVSNTAESSGGGTRIYDSHAVFTGCVFYSNDAGYGGAAVANGGQSHPVFQRCFFRFNRTDTLFALHDGYGGGMHNTDDVQPLLVSCRFLGNTAYATLPALSYGGALAHNDNAQSTVINCTLLNNYANIGHGQYADGQSGSTVTNSILWHNLWSSGDEIVVAGSAAVDVTYSTVKDSWPGIGNLADDPLLDPTRLLPGSPCINAGDPAYTPVWETDLDGHARVLCGRVDMGAYEFGLGDFTCDQSVDLADYAHWDTCMTGPSAGPYVTGCESFDTEYDGDVDLADFARFQELTEAD